MKKRIVALILLVLCFVLLLCGCNGGYRETPFHNPKEFGEGVADPLGINFSWAISNQIEKRTWDASQFVVEYHYYYNSALIMAEGEITETHIRLECTMYTNYVFEVKEFRDGEFAGSKLYSYGTRDDGREAVVTTTLDENGNLLEESKWIAMVNDNEKDRRIELIDESRILNYGATNSDMYDDSTYQKGNVCTFYVKDDDLDEKYSTVKDSNGNDIVLYKAYETFIRFEIVGDVQHLYTTSQHEKIYTYSTYNGKQYNKPVLVMETIGTVTPIFGEMQEYNGLSFA